MQDAAEVFRLTSEAFREAGNPPTAKWIFGPKEGEAVAPYLELRDLGLIEPMSLGDRDWCFTPQGRLKALGVV